MRFLRVMLAFVLLLLLSLPVIAGGHRRDPMTDAEADQIREASDKPQKRFHLYITFAKARLTTIDQLRADPKMAQGRGQQIHDLLEDFQALVDETEANLDDYRSRKADLIKPLTELVQAEDDWKLRLRALKELNTPEAKEYEFVLQNAIETVNDSSDSARKELEDIGGRVPKEKEKKK
jgi:hypothetical protein